MDMNASNASYFTKETTGLNLSKTQNKSKNMDSVAGFRGQNGRNNFNLCHRFSWKKKDGEHGEHILTQRFWHHMIVSNYPPVIKRGNWESTIYPLVN